MENKKNKHMTLDDRIEIQACLSKGMTFKAIAQRIGKDPTTISKEVKLHSKTQVNGFTKTDEVCPKLLKAPFVCNGCSKCSNAGCKYPRRKYVARLAQNEYESTLVSSREGIPLNKSEFYDIEETIYQSVNRGQHIYHAIQTNNLNISKSTVYRHIEKGYYRISKIDLPRAVKFKPRKSKQQDYVPKAAKIGRTYDDFKQYIAEHNINHYVEMDTVLGTIGGKLIMTFIFTGSDFMFGLLLDDKTAAEASTKIKALKSKLLSAGFSFGEIFPVLLTDNGGEFSCVSSFENDLNSMQESNLFFCDPNSPYQKPHVENNHTLLRNIVPSGTSFDDFCQDTVNLIFSHINSVKRKQFNGKSAYEMFSFTYSNKLAETLGISFIQPESVVQSPKLLR